VPSQLSLTPCAQLANKLRRRRDCGLLGCLLASAVALLYTLLEPITKFATVRMAITGESFLAAGKAVAALLGRSGMDTTGVWWLPPLVLHSGAALLSGAWGWGVYWAARWAAPAAAARMRLRGCGWPNAAGGRLLPGQWARAQLPPAAAAAPLASPRGAGC
jgi:hypothetical protein